LLTRLGQLFGVSDQAQALVYLLLRSSGPPQRSWLRRCSLLHLQIRATSTKPPGRN
jgi:hypothetical protein